MFSGFVNISLKKFIGPHLTNSPSYPGVPLKMIFIINSLLSLFVIQIPVTRDIIWTLIQHFLDVIDVRWTSKQRCVLAEAVNFQKKRYFEKKAIIVLKGGPLKEK